MHGHPIVTRMLEARGCDGSEAPGCPIRATIDGACNCKRENASRSCATSMTSFACLTTVPCAFAEPTAQEKTLALQLFKEGTAAMNKGDFAAACPKLEAATKYDPTMDGAVLNLAICFEVVIWGGQDNSHMALADGARYNPSTNSWTALTAPPASMDGRFYNGAAADASGNVFLWGGQSNTRIAGSFDRSDGALWSLASGWAYIDPPSSSVLGAVTRDGPLTWFAASRFWIWSGGEDGSPVGGGASFDPATSTWSAMSGVGEPAARTQATVVTTGSQAIVWGGYDASSKYLANGARYVF